MMDKTAEGVRVDVARDLFVIYTTVARQTLRRLRLNRQFPRPHLNPRLRVARTIAVNKGIVVMVAPVLRRMLQMVGHCSRTPSEGPRT